MISLNNVVYIVIKEEKELGRFRTEQEAIDFYRNQKATQIIIQFQDIEGGGALDISGSVYGTGGN